MNTPRPLPLPSPPPPPPPQKTSSYFELIPIYFCIFYKKREMDWVKSDFVPPSQAPNWMSTQSYFLAVILSRHVLKNMTVKWFKETKLFALPKVGSLRGSTSPSLKIDKLLAIRKNLASFWNWGSHLLYATC